MSSLTPEPRGHVGRTAAARDRVREAHRSGRLQDWWYDLLDVGRQPRIVRAGLRYVVALGNLGSGGVTFTALLSLTAMATLGLHLLTFVGLSLKDGLRAGRQP